VTLRHMDARQRLFPATVFFLDLNVAHHALQLNSKIK
jgi:hypothetical protein